MTAVSTIDRDRLTIQCCVCRRRFALPDIASDLTIVNIICPYCGKNGILVKECRRLEVT